MKTTKFTSLQPRKQLCKQLRKRPRKLLRRQQVCKRLSQQSKNNFRAVESQESGESDNESIPEFLTMNADSGDNILLPMVTILVQGADGKKHRALGLMDSGSQRSFICKNL